VTSPQRKYPNFTEHEGCRLHTRAGIGAAVRACAGSLVWSHGRPAEALRPAIPCQHVKTRAFCAALPRLPNA